MGEEKYEHGELIKKFVQKVWFQFCLSLMLKFSYKLRFKKRALIDIEI